MSLLLIHTGGTIGMAPGPLCLAPAPGLVEAAVAARLPDGAGRATYLFAPLRDSADIGPAEWNEILDALVAHPGLPALITRGTGTDGLYRRRFGTGFGGAGWPGDPVRSDAALGAGRRCREQP